MHPVWHVAITVLTWALALGWVWQTATVWRGIGALADLREFDGGLPGSAEAEAEFDLTVIVPACNEAKSIEAGLRSLVSSTGIRLQVIAVDDRSTDETGEILDRFAAHHGSTQGGHAVEIVHLRELPSGWLGKTRAMHAAAERAKSPWLLFTDADVSFAAEALERAVGYAEAMKADHFVLVPTMARETMMEGAMASVLNTLAQWATHYWKVGDPAAKDFVGVGGFNMIRTSVYEALGGFSALKMEVVEDMSLGWMAKRAGYRSLIATGLGLVKIHWIEGFLGVVRNIEKNGFSAFRYRTGLTLLACAGLLIEVLLPIAAAFEGGWALAAACTMYLALGLNFYANRRLNDTHPVAAILFAPCALVVCYGVLRSWTLTLRNEGVNWRGVHYSLAELKENAASWK